MQHKSFSVLIATYFMHSLHGYVFYCYFRRMCGWELDITELLGESFLVHNAPHVYACKP